MAEGDGERGGILGLLDLIEEHRGAVEYDFRARFQLPIEEFGFGVGWGEAVRLVRILRADPSSMITAALEGWDYPFSREIAVLMDLYDLEYAKSGAKDRKPYPRPFETDTRERTRKGNAGGRTVEEVKAILRRYREGITTT